MSHDTLFQSHFIWTASHWRRTEYKIKIANACMDMVLPSCWRARFRSDLGVIDIALLQILQLATSHA
jgi:hypothetical protein